MRRVHVFVLLMAVWVILSGNLDFAHLSMGVIACLFVTIISGDLMFQDDDKAPFIRLRQSLGLAVYIPWLLWEVVLANLHVLKLALLPGGINQVQPRIVRYKTYLKSQSSRFIFANSITLTPGTVTLKMDGDMLYVHAISEEAANSIGGEMERRIGKIYGEEQESAN